MGKVKVKTVDKGFQETLQILANELSGGQV